MRGSDSLRPGANAYNHL